LFGEKYGDEVRVVAMGEGGGNSLGWSVELCGGTHVNRTGDIGLISVVGESAVASGVRRIEALTAQAARANANNLARLAKATATELRVPIDEVPARVAALLDERKRLERELSEAKKKLAMGGGGKAADGDDGVENIAGVKVMAKTLSGVDAKDLRSLADEGKKKLGSGIVILVASDPEGKAALVVGVTGDLTGANNAVQMVQAGVAELGGKGGGGRPDMAQGGGPNGGAAQAALAVIKKLVKPAASQTT
jgi:alanyl-tRNA synthetase